VGDRRTGRQVEVGTGDMSWQTMPSNYRREYLSCDNFEGCLRGLDGSQKQYTRSRGREMSWQVCQANIGRM
jgi:hypothetical protein